LKHLRELYPDRVFLIPGVGSQGASAEDVMDANSGKLSLVNVSRAIIFAGSDEQIVDECKKYKVSLNFDSK